MMRLPENFRIPGEAVPPEPPPTPARARDAATVLILRQGPDGPEVFLQRRVSGMSFAGGMTVFPGGGVDRGDAELPAEWSGPEPDWWAERFGCSPESAGALVCAAVRETFEESGVLLAGPDPRTVVADTAGYADARSALVSGDLSLARFLGEAGLVLRADLLRPWSNWITPVTEPRRYDTRFFLAAMPPGQCADARTTEAAEAYWSTPARALEDWNQGRCALMPPTWASLTEIGEYDSVDTALEAERALPKVLPELVRRDGEWLIQVSGEEE